MVPRYSKFIKSIIHILYIYIYILQYYNINLLAAIIIKSEAAKKTRRRRLEHD